MHRLHAVHRSLPRRRDHRRAEAHARDPAVAVLRLRAVRRALPRRLHLDGRRAQREWTAADAGAARDPSRRTQRAGRARERIANRRRRAVDRISRAREATSRSRGRARAGPRAPRREPWPKLPSPLARSFAPHRSDARHDDCRRRDFSEQLDKLWNYGKPAESEARFAPSSPSIPRARPKRSRSRTQIARTDSLQRKFAEADKTLDGVQPKLHASARAGQGALPPRARQDPQLDRRQARGRAAVPRGARRSPSTTRCPARTSIASTRCTCWGSPRLGTKRLDWNLQGSPRRKLRRMRVRADGSLALQQHRLDLLRSEGSEDRARLLAKGAAAARSGRQRDHDPDREMDGRARPARRRQPRRGARRFSSRSSPRPSRPRNPTATSTKSSPRSRSRAAGATMLRPWAAKAHALLKDDAHMQANEAARLARLADLAQGKVKLNPAKRRAIFERLRAANPHPRPSSRTRRRSSSWSPSCFPRRRPTKA